MGTPRVDTLARTLAAASTRRELLARLAVLPLASLMAVIAPEDVAGHGRRKRRTKRHKHGDNRRRTPRRQTRCQSPRQRCGKSCVDLRADAAHCGACGTACAAGMECVAGTCRCLTSCPDGCCDAAGACLDGRGQSACGQAGAACAPCAADNVCRDDALGGICQVNQPPAGADASYDYDEGIRCALVTLSGTDPEGDALAFQLDSQPEEGKLFLYDESAPFGLGRELTTSSPAVPAEAGTDALRLCYAPDSRFFHGSDSFEYTVGDVHGAKSPGWLIQITIHDIN